MRSVFSTRCARGVAAIGLLATALQTGCSSLGGDTGFVPKDMGSWQRDKDSPQSLYFHCGDFDFEFYAGNIAHNTYSIGPPVLPIVPVLKENDFDLQIDVAAIPNENNPKIYAVPGSLMIEMDGKAGSTQLSATGNIRQQKYWGNRTKTMGLYTFRADWKKVDAFSIAFPAIDGCTPTPLVMKKTSEVGYQPLVM